MVDEDYQQNIREAAEASKSEHWNVSAIYIDRFSQILNRIFLPSQFGAFLQDLNNIWDVSAIYIDRFSQILNRIFLPSQFGVFLQDLNNI